MKTDRELLELAARAAGVKDFVFCAETGAPFDAVGYWNPLTDDGDALRLAVQLGLDILRTEMDVEAIAGLPPYADINPHSLAVPFGLVSIGDDPYAATRRAIVRAAAAIGEGMK